jgi:outer membrane lipoprotein SlyB
MSTHYCNFCNATVAGTTPYAGKVLGAVAGAAAGPAIASELGLKRHGLAAAVIGSAAAALVGHAFDAAATRLCSRCGNAVQSAA